MPARAQDLIDGPGGKLWFTVAGDGIGSMTTTGAVSLYGLKKHINIGKLAAGPDGRLWFTGSLLRRQLGTITTRGAATYYKGGISGTPVAVVTGADHKLWFVEANPNRIAQLTPSKHGKHRKHRKHTKRRRVHKKRRH